jgi:hypothetical protein
LIDDIGGLVLGLVFCGCGGNDAHGVGEADFFRGVFLAGGLVLASTGVLLSLSGARGNATCVQLTIVTGVVVVEGCRCRVPLQFSPRSYKGSFVRAAAKNERGNQVATGAQERIECVAVP